MRLTKFFTFRRFLILLICAVLTLAVDFLPESTGVATVYAAKKSRSSTSKKSRKTGKKVRKTGRKGKKGSRRGKNSKYRNKHRRSAVIATLYRSEDGTQWVRRGGRGIIVSRDSTGVVRAMAPFSSGSQVGRGYASAVSDYARALRQDSVRVYMLIAPSQGEYYMPAQAVGNRSQQISIAGTAAALDASVTPVFVDSVFREHRSEEIFNRTDHHWSPLGAYYAAGEFARTAGVPFLPLSAYRTDTVHNYVGTMHRMSGDPEVKKAPEDFIYYIPPAGYKAEFIDYRLSGGRTVSESVRHQGDFFRRYSDGSGAAYCTFMGGDNHTVKVTSTGGTPGRRLLIVKDSFGNAMASCLFASFEEVHVADFRYFPHNIAEYVRDNDITDLLFVNCTSIAFAPKTSARLLALLNAGGVKSADIEVEEEDESADDEDDEDDADDEENEEEIQETEQEEDE